MTGARRDRKSSHEESRSLQPDGCTVDLGRPSRVMGHREEEVTRFIAVDFELESIARSAQQQNILVGRTRSLQSSQRTGESTMVFRNVEIESGNLPWSGYGIQESRRVGEKRDGESRRTFENPNGIGSLAQRHEPDGVRREMWGYREVGGVVRICPELHSRARRQRTGRYESQRMEASRNGPSLENSARTKELQSRLIAGVNQDGEAGAPGGEVESGFGMRLDLEKGNRGACSILGPDRAALCPGSLSE